MESENLKSEKFPKNPEKGDTVRKLVNGRIVTFEATGLEGFGKWKITGNDPLSVLEQKTMGFRVGFPRPPLLPEKKVKSTDKSMKEAQKAQKKREQKLDNKPNLKGLTISALESREEFLRKHLERTKSKVFDYKMNLIQIEFDLKHTLPTDDAVEIATNIETLSKKENTVKHNLKVHEKRLNQNWKALDEVARERKSRTLKPEKSKFKLW